jgi:hypothetical protein
MLRQPIAYWDWRSSQSVSNSASVMGWLSVP